MKMTKDGVVKYIQPNSVFEYTKMGWKPYEEAKPKEKKEEPIRKENKNYSFPKREEKERIEEEN